MTLSQPFIDEGLTQASIVIPLVRSSLVAAPSGTLSESAPSNDSARPNLPPATRVGAVAPPPSVPLIGAADESTTAVPLVSSNPSASTTPPAGGGGGGAGAVTVTLTAPEAEPPRLSTIE